VEPPTHFQGIPFRNGNGLNASLFPSLLARDRRRRRGGFARANGAGRGGSGAVEGGGFADSPKLITLSRGTKIDEAAWRDERREPLFDIQFYSSGEKLMGGNETGSSIRLARSGRKCEMRTRQRITRTCAVRASVSRNASFSADDSARRLRVARRSRRNRGIFRESSPFAYE